MYVAEFDCVYCGAPAESLTEDEYLRLKYECRDNPEGFAPSCNECVVAGEPEASREAAQQARAEAMFFGSGEDRHGY